MVCEGEFQKEGRRLKVDCLGCFYGSSIEDFDMCMAKTIDKLIELPRVESIVLSATREYEYGYEQTKMLREIAGVVKRAVRMKISSLSNLGGEECIKYLPGRVSFLQEMIVSNLRRDPIGAYVRLVREIRLVYERIKTSPEKYRSCYAMYLKNALLPLKDALESTELIQRVKGKLMGYHIGDRSLYRELFHPTIRPNFMLTRFMSTLPKMSEEIDRYMVDRNEIRIFRVQDDVRPHYHVMPPEFNLSEAEYTILDAARRYLAGHRPKKSDFMDPERTREIFTSIGRDMISDIADNMQQQLSTKKIEELSKILTRYTAGFGILEIILADENIQDVYLNAPIGRSPFFIFHSKYEDCTTNIIPTIDDAESWATRFRIISGRPLDEANPVLDTELEVPGGRARIAAITRSLSPDGLAFALRRHRDKPWTYPLLISHKSFNSLAGGLLNFIIDGARSMIFAGTRSAGKTSILGALISELMPRTRIVSVEDTLELPITAFQKLGYNIERMKSRSVITHVESELSADEAIRTSLRLGDSALIIGEVRSKEARALYESMRIGALANVVAGTIHGDSPYGVFDRVVNDLGVPATSFKATDIIVIANRLKSADGLKTYRRVLEITEVRKEWDEDPLKEKAFVPLMVYNAKKDALEPTETFLNGESYILNEIGKRVKEWRDNWEAIWDNIQLRTKIKETLIDYSGKTKNPSILEAPFVVQANNKFHIISERVRDEYGSLDSERIFNRWNEWAKGKIKETLPR